MFALHTLSPKVFVLQLAMAEFLDQKTAQIRRSETGGSEIWAWGVPKDGECWAQGWHSPKPENTWWTTTAKEWSLLGYKLMVIDTAKAKKAFFVHPNGYRFVDSGGTEHHLAHARLSSAVSSEGGKGPSFVQLLNAGKGRQEEEAAYSEGPKKKTKLTSLPKERSEAWRSSQSWSSCHWGPPATGHW